MNCQVFQTRLACYLSGGMEPAEAAELEQHFASCRRCGQSLDLAAGRDAGPGAELVDGVLARTSGSPCAAARWYLCLAQDGGLDSLQTRLLERHMEHCPDCARFGELLREMAVVLPTLAQADPGPGFTASVLDASRKLARQPPAGWHHRLQSCFRRPLFPLEAAYVGTLVFVLGFTAVLGAPSASTLSRLESAVAPVSSWVEKVDPYWHRWSSGAADQVEALRDWSLEMRRRCEQETARIADAVQQRVRRAAGRP